MLVLLLPVLLGCCFFQEMDVGEKHKSTVEEEEREERGWEIWALAQLPVEEAIAFKGK